MRNNQNNNTNREPTDAVADGIDSVGAVRYQHAGTGQENGMKIVHSTTSFAIIIIIIYHVIPVKL